MNYLELLRWHNYHKCPYAGKCKAKFEDGVVQVKRDGDKIVGWYPDGGFLFHYQDTHGFPHELTIELFEKLINSEMTQNEIDTYNKIMKHQAPVPTGGRSSFEELEG